MKPYRMHLLICDGTNCHAQGNGELSQQFRKLLDLLGLTDDVQVVNAGCFGFCAKGPIVWVYPDDVVYAGVKLTDAVDIVKEHILGGHPVERLLFDPDTYYPSKYAPNIPLNHGTLKIALRNCGVIDPERIEDYIECNGYEALGRVLTQMTPEDVIDLIKRSGLRGKGGAGFPTGLKWEFTHNSISKNNQKYIICNADEGDPGAFMDRSVLEGDPHSVLEAMAIAGYAIGASQGAIYVRAEYPLAVKRLENAIAQAEEMGFLGDNIFGSGFSFRIRLDLGAGAFVCGEETALMRSIEGNRGEPRMKPPFPAVSGLFGEPTSINNVETLASVCPIILNGAEWFASIGTEKSKGTKVFALAGKVNKVGLAEVPMGTPLRDIVYKIGGGIRGGKKLKAVQTGGPAGGCIPAELVDTSIDFESLAAVGSIMGSGGMIVMDEDDCMVNIAKFFLDFTVDESCGKCTPCRVGNKRLHEILTRITMGQGTEKDLDDLEELGAVIKDCALCGLGQASPNPVLSTLKYFRDEYLEHVVDKHCRAGVCTSLVNYRILPEKCVGCTICATNCPAKCIIGERKQVHVINTAKCLKCGTCFAKCPVDAIVKE